MSTNKPMDCDICGESCLHFFIPDDPEASSPEYATLQAHWGFFSKKDLYKDECVMCEKCFDKVTAFILLLGGKIRRTVTDPWRGVEEGSHLFHNDFFDPLFTCKAEPEVYNEEDT